MAKENERKVDTGIVQRGANYRFTACLGYDLKGKQIRKTMTFSPPHNLTQKKADKLAKEEYMNFVNKCKGFFTLKDNMRFSELTDEYFRIYAPNKLKETTAYNYYGLVNLHLLNYFGNKKLKDIHAPVLNEFFATYKCMRGNKLQPPTYETSKKLLTIMQSIFKFAVSQEYIQDTPCKNIILPKKKLSTKKQNHVNPEEIYDFLEYFSGYSTLNTIVKLLLHTGLRSGECLALMWEDVDFTNDIIHIRHNLLDVSGKHIISTTKTKSSNRTIYMNESLKALLEQHKIEQNKHIKLLGSSYEHTEMVFTSNTGGYKDRSSLLKSYKKVLKGTKFEYMTLHKLRHTNATLLFDNGLDLKIVSSHLGHSDVAITANTYVAITNNSKIRTANIMDKILGENTKNEEQTPNKQQNSILDNKKPL